MMQHRQTESHMPEKLITAPVDIEGQVFKTVYYIIHPWHLITFFREKIVLDATNKTSYLSDKSWKRFATKITFCRMI